MPETSDSDHVSMKQRQIAELAKRHPMMAFTSLNHHLDLDWLREAFFRTRKNGAPGVDGQTWADYAENLEEDGFSKWTSASFSTRWIMAIYGDAWGHPSMSRPQTIARREIWVSS